MELPVWSFLQKYTCLALSLLGLWFQIIEIVVYTYGYFASISMFQIHFIDQMWIKLSQTNFGFNFILYRLVSFIILNVQNKIEITDT
jgi:hypothetical protein